MGGGGVFKGGLAVMNLTGLVVLLLLRNSTIYEIYQLIEKTFQFLDH